eukprot:Cvel_30806.t1-p1 / transcript=Cvel_30806.t1 / gene=Cvel_30806 / organism=Chromera_velia_CCMP2878 / gene_product=UPF0553 protein, putative / transcript_product=UPF0553 protein, putative / location=Cvel_scaffold4460:3252-7233(+) / protein_length=288 / sequence_SO=supercontig / SO=protein_coding / is_pseudo=false
MQSPSHVQMGKDEDLRAFVQRIRGGVLSGEGAGSSHSSKDTLFPVWRRENFHFCEEPPSELQALYVLVMDSVNFCFWPTETEMGGSFEYEDLAGCLKDVAERTPEKFAPANLARLTEEELKAWFAQRWSASSDPSPLPSLPLCEERCRLLRELGQTLSVSFGGSALKFIDGAEGSAVALVRRIAATFPGFRDSSVYRGRQVFFYKRAQIAVADLWGAFRHPNAPPHLFQFDDIDGLTMFPDYRVPQLLRAEGLLNLSPAFAACVDGRKEVTAMSEEEAEIRAASVLLC